MTGFEVTHLQATLIASFSANTNGVGQDVSDFKYGSVQVVGTFNANIQLQGSNDGTNWVSFGAAITTAGFTELDLYYAHIRVNVNTYVGGTAAVYLTAKP